MTWRSILLDCCCWCSYFVVLQVGHQRGYISTILIRYVRPNVGLSRQRHLFTCRVLSTQTGPTFLRYFQETKPPITQWSPWWLVFTRISPPYPHACHRWQLKWCFDSLSYIILSSGFDGLGLWSNDRLNVVCRIPFHDRGGPSWQLGPKKLTPQCRCLTNPGKWMMSMCKAWEPDRRSNLIFSQPVHVQMLYVPSHIHTTKISSIMK